MSERGDGPNAVAQAGQATATSYSSQNTLDGPAKAVAAPAAAPLDTRRR
jgi:hypothetical protein